MDKNIIQTNFTGFIYDQSLYMTSGTKCCAVFLKRSTTGFVCICRRCKNNILQEEDGRRTILHTNCLHQAATGFVQLNRVSGFNAGHIFVDIFMIMHHTVMKFGLNVEAKHTNDL